jgi:Zn-dependent peptidase ImmA (M78 family)
MGRAKCSVSDLQPRFPHLAEWLTGELRPTLKQLESFAGATHTPFGYFFLPQPPVEHVPIPDFRSAGGHAFIRPSPDLLDTIYICQQRQQWYREYALITAEKPFPLVGSSRRTDDLVGVADRMRSALAFDLDERRRIPTWTDALRRFIEQAEHLGVLVMVNGVVGSNNRRKLNPGEFRGFALCDELAPLVFINGADTKAGQMFTLAHELAHLWLGESALTDAEPRTEPNNAVERWCDRVAAELLVPLAVFGQEYRSDADLRSELDRLARQFKVSTLVILRRMHDAGGITREQLWSAYDAELHRLTNLPRTSGGDFYLTTAARVGKRFARAVVSSTWEGRSSFTEAFHLLGFKKISTFRELGQSLGVAI